jgi:hypothetical protein
MIPLKPLGIATYKILGHDEGTGEIDISYETRNILTTICDSG